MEMDTHVKVIFPANSPDEPSWPYVGYDVDRRSAEVLSTLRQRLPDLKFTGEICRSAEQAEQAFQKEAGEGHHPYDGYLVYMTALWTGVAEYYVRNARPVIVADELYAGSGGLLKVYSLIKQDNLPAVGVASSNFEDVVETVRLIDVMKKMRGAKILELVMHFE